MTEIFGFNILTLLIFAPIIGGVILLLLPKNKLIVRWSALGISILTGVLALTVFTNYVQ